MDDKRLLGPHQRGDAHDSDASQSVPREVEVEQIGQMIRDIPFPPGEVAAVKERIGVMLAIAMLQPVPLRGGAGTGRQRRAPRRYSLFQGLTAAATLMVFITLAVGVSRASASAMPSSPLYALKRAEEWAALNTAWSDQRRGDVLVVMARRRLDEAIQESTAGHKQRAQSLVQEYQSDVVAIADLVGRMTTQHENPQTLVAQLASVLSAQQDATHVADQSGDSTFVDELSAAGRASQAAIDANRILLPGPIPGFHNGDGSTATPGSNKPTSPTRLPEATPPTPTKTPDGRGTGGSHGGSGGIDGHSIAPTGDQGATYDLGDTVIVTTQSIGRFEQVISRKVIPQTMGVIMTSVTPASSSRLSDAL